MKRGFRYRLNEDQMISLSRETFDTCRKDLVENLEPRRHFSTLKKCSIMIESECSEIDSATSRETRADKLVDILKTKGNKGYLALAESLIENKTQIFLLKLLNQTFEKRRRNLERNLDQPRSLDISNYTPNYLSLQSESGPLCMNLDSY